MSEERPTYIHRTSLIDGFRALYLAHLRFDRVLKEDSYACGYRDGFEDSLQSLAELVGIKSEFETLKKNIPATHQSNVDVIMQLNQGAGSSDGFD